VIGHSYGSTTVGVAGMEGLEADAVALIGSPGGKATTASEYEAIEHVYAGTNEDDWIDHLQQDLAVGFDVPFTDHRLEVATSLQWHGPHPTTDDFGAVVFDTDGASGHGSDEYFRADTESLDNLVRIVRGGHDEVTTR
jgi:hypothetical protein